MSSRAPWLHGRYPASSLLRAPPPPSRLRPTSRGDTGYTAYLAPPISRWDEDGFSSCSAHPCHRATPTTPPERIDVSVSIRRFVLPSLERRELGLRSQFLCRGHLWVHLRCGPVTRSPSRPGDSLTIPKMALSVGFRTLGFPPVCDSSYRAPDSCPGGTASRWMRQPSTGRTAFSIFIRSLRESDQRSPRD
jgi:hypothetical protein